MGHIHTSLDEKIVLRAREQLKSLRTESECRIQLEMSPLP